MLIEENAIPYGYKIIGKCSICDGNVIQKYEVTNFIEQPFCHKCGAVKEKPSNIITMTKSN